MRPAPCTPISAVLLSFLGAAALESSFGCSDDDGAPCRCGTGEFCCIDRCLPLGSVCGTADGSLDDSGAEADAAGDAASETDAGSDAGPDCPLDCNPGYWCVRWSSEAGPTEMACVETGRSPCDPAERPRCEGDERIECQAQGQEGAPPGLTFATDCTERVGPGSTCQDGAEGPECSGTPCDPDTFVPVCDGDGMLGCDAALELVRRSSCPDEQYTCREIAIDGCAGPTCIPRVAVQAQQANCERIGLSCDGEALRLAQFGWEWSEQCDEPDRRRCFDLDASEGGPRCLPRDTEFCDPESFQPECTADGLSETSCAAIGDPEPHVVMTEYCGIPLVGGSVPSACDDETGRCYPTTFCTPLTPVPYCSADGRFLVRCDEDWDREIAEACACLGEPGAAVCD